MKTERSLTLAMLLPLIASGCFEVSDLEAVAPTDAATDAAPDWTSDDASQEDAGELVESDAGTPDAYVPPSGPCTATSCGEDQVCAPSGVCLQRCDAAGVCLIASTPRIVTALMADGPMLYVALGSTTDRFGNVAPDAELRTVVGDGPLTLLTTLPENAKRIERHGEQLYWTGTRLNTLDKKLRRISKGAVSGPESLYASANLTPGNVVYSDTHVAFRQPDGIYVGTLDGATELRKVRDCPAVPQDYADFCQPTTLHGDALYYLRPGEPQANDPSPVVLSSFDLVTAEQKDHGSAYHDAKFVAIEPPYIYLSATSFSTAQMIYRRDMRDPTLPDFTIWQGLSPYFSFPDNESMRLRGDWVYMLATESVFGNGESKKRLVFERTAASGPVNVQSILPDTFGSPSTDWPVDYALTDTHAFFAVVQTSQTGTLGSLVYRIPLAK